MGRERENDGICERRGERRKKRGGVGEGGGDSSLYPTPRLFSSPSPVPTFVLLPLLPFEGFFFCESLRAHKGKLFLLFRFLYVFKVNFLQCKLILRKKVRRTGQHSNLILLILVSSFHLVSQFIVSRGPQPSRSLPFPTVQPPHCIEMELEREERGRGGREIKECTFRCFLGGRGRKKEERGIKTMDGEGTTISSLSERKGHEFALERKVAQTVHRKRSQFCGGAQFNRSRVSFHIDIINAFSHVWRRKETSELL